MNMGCWGRGQKLIRDYTKSSKSLAIFFSQINIRNTLHSSEKISSERTKIARRSYNMECWICFFRWQRYEYFTPCYAKLNCFQLFCDPINCSPPGFSVHGISQEIILEWVAMPSSRGSSQPTDGTHISCSSRIVGRLFTTESPGK